MRLYDKLNIPSGCKVDKTIYKKLFYENTDLSNADKTLFTDVIDKVTWLYCLKPETINVLPYKDDTHDYPEIEVIEVALICEKGLSRIAEIIMRGIPYPMLLVFALNDKVQFWAAHQRTSMADTNKNTLAAFEHSTWVTADAPLLVALNIKAMRFSNYFMLYSDMVDAISIYNAKAIFGQQHCEMSGDDARQLTAKIEEIDHQIEVVRADLKKEMQFNRKMSLNILVKRLEHQKITLIGAQQNT